MGSGIAQVACLGGFETRLHDPIPEALDEGERRLRAALVKGAERGRWSSDEAERAAERLHPAPKLGDLSGCELVIEAAPEDLDIKRELFDELAGICGPQTVLATNTSSLSVTEMASGLQHPERVVGFHFFNPVAVLPLLEIARAERTDDAALATAFAIGKLLKKSCVLVRDAPAFVVNRVLTRFLGEVTAAVDEGTPFEVADRALGPLGLPMSPFVLLQLVGPAVALHVAETMHEAFPDRFPVSANLARMVAAGKTGVYLWEGATQSVDPEVAELFELGTNPLSEEEVRRRALDALAEEIHLMLAEGVVADVRDIDLCLLLGAGWPFHLGGITPYLDRTGVSERVNGARFLPSGVASLPTSERANDSV